MVILKLLHILCSSESLRGFQTCFHKISRTGKKLLRFECSTVILFFGELNRPNKLQVLYQLFKTINLNFFNENNKNTNSRFLSFLILNNLQN